mgnify:CR=1 FL=1
MINGWLTVSQKIKRMRKQSTLLILVLVSFLGRAQQATFNKIPFEALKVCNLESTKIVKGGELYFNVGHRFGSVKGGVNTFFGLDQSNTKIQLIYGLADIAHIGLSRESIRKTYSGELKVAFLKQEDSRWCSLTGHTSINVNTELNKETYPKMLFFDRLSYATQLIAAKKVSERWTIQLSPTFIRQNLVLEPFQLHNQIGLGLGTRVRVSQRLSINAEYMMNVYRARESIYKDGLSMGLDFETGGHVFQLLFSNAQSMNGPGFMTNAEGNWLQGDIFFGFNISRKFKLH